MKRQSLSVRVFIFANVLLWGVNIPLFRFDAELHLIVTILIGFFIGISKFTVPKKVVIAVAIIAIIGGLSYLFGPCIDGAAKVFASLALLPVLVLSISWIASRVIFEAPLVSLNDALFMFFLIVSSVVFDFLIKIFYGGLITEIRASGFFLEPSHLALSASPLIFYLWFCGRKIMLYGVLLGLAVLFVASYSSTLLVMIFILLFLPYLGRVIKQPESVSSIYHLFALLLILPLVIALVVRPDTLLRITDILFLREDSNLSSLVYAHGWQLLWSNLISTHGFGLGFNAMGCSPRPVTSISGWLAALNLEDQNATDGSFILSKIGSELGIIGIFLFTIATLYALKLLLKVLFIRSNLTLVILTGWFAVATIGGLVRSGGGYFSGPLILGVFALFVIMSEMKNQRTRLCNSPSTSLKAPSFH